MKQQKRFKEAGGEVGYKILRVLAKTDSVNIGTLSLKIKHNQGVTSSAVTRLVKLDMAVKKRKGQEVFVEITDLGHQLLSVGV